MLGIKLIILQGGNNSGKTESLRNLIKMITESNDGNFICQNDKSRFERSKEITVPVIYKGVLVAISTYGDSKAEMLLPYNNYKDFAQIYVCAAHPYGSPDELVQEWKASCDDITFVIKNKATKENEYTENIKTSQKLFEVLNSLI